MKYNLQESLAKLAKKWQQKIKQYDIDHIDSSDPEGWVGPKFQFSRNQLDKISKWENNHDCNINLVGAIGGKITYQFTPTSIGLVEKVLCACGKEIDVTDYSDW